MTRAILVAVVAAVLASALATGIAYRQFLDTPLDIPGHELRLVVRPGDSLQSVIGQLAAEHALRKGWRWWLLTRQHPDPIQAGEYALPEGITPPELLRKLSAGEVIQHRFTIVEGWTYRQLSAALMSDDRLSADPDLLAADRVMAAVGSEESHPEGWFLPETYAFVRGDTALDLLRRAHRAMRQLLEETWRGRYGDLPLTSPYELLILASIIEKESALHSERPEIAGVFVRRLQQGWRLETDPTVIYGLGAQFDGNIRRRDLRADTPYNTYTRHGLPPTPIAMPGRTAVQAAAWPAAGTAMFFVADGNGGHVFSDTLEQHNAAVQQLLQRRRNNRRGGS